MVVSRSKVERMQRLFPWLVRILGAVDLALFRMLGVSATWLLRRRVTAKSVRAKALAAAGVDQEVYHVSIEEIDKRIQKRIDAMVAMDDDKVWAGCGASGGGLRLGSLSIFMFEGRMVRTLVADLYVTKYAAKKNLKVRPPVFIMGSPRSGTTLLHELLAADHRWRVLTAAEGLMPVVEKDQDAMHLMLGGFAATMDGMKHIHHERWDGPTECRSCLENGLGAPHLTGTLFGAPIEYLTHDARNDYDFYAVQLAVLAHLGEDKRDWLLKNPMHCQHVADLFAAFPGAKVIWTHRHPKQSAASICSLQQHIMRWNLRDDGDTTAKSSSSENPWETLVVDRVVQSLDAATDFCDKHPKAPIHNVFFKDLVSDPISVVEGIYDFIQVPLSTDAKANMRAYMDQNKRDKRSGNHKYALADFGLDEARIDTLFSKYLAVYGDRL